MIIEKYSNIQALPASFQNSFIEDIDKKNKNLFKKMTWFDLLQKHISCDGREVIYYCVLDETQNIQAIFPLIKTYGKDRKGYSLSSLANYYSMEYEPYFCKKTRNCQKEISIFVDYLATEEKGWTHLSLFPMDAGKLSTLYLKEALQKYFKLTHSLSHKNWVYENTAKNFREYLSASPSRIKDIARKERRLNREHEVSFKLWSDKTNIEEGITDYFNVYHQSWKDEEHYKGFIPDLMRLCATEKTLRLGILYVDNIATAAQFNIFHGTTTLIYKLSYHEDYKHLSTGAILSLKMMQQAFDQDHSTEIDYGSGNDPYKREWMTYCHEKIILTAYNNNFSGKYHYLKKTWKARLKQFILPMSNPRV